MAHSVSGHLGLEIAEYDRRIRQLVPGYASMREQHLAAILALCPRPDARILDLGGETGSLAAAIVERLPGATVEIWDTDEAMLAVAAGRCAAYGDRVRRVPRSFAGELPPCDLVVACIALHHVRDLGAKQAIYAGIWQSLASGGAFLNADTAVGTSPRLRAWTFERWAGGMAAQGIDRATAYRYFEDWAREDFYPPLAEELALLRRAGFGEPECFWREGPFLVFGGVKD